MSKTHLVKGQQDAMIPEFALFVVLNFNTMHPQNSTLRLAEVTDVMKTHVVYDNHASNNTII